MTAAIVASSRPRPAARPSGAGSPDTSNGVGTAPSKSEPSPTWSAPTMATAWAIERAIEAAIVAAGGRRPEPDARPSRRSRRSRGAGRREVPRVVGDATDAGVRRDDGPRRDRQDVVDRGRRRVRHVDDHPSPLQLRDQLPPGLGQAALLDRRAPSPRTRCRRSGRARTSGSPLRSSRSRLARSSSRAWAPSIARSPATSAGAADRRARNASRSAAERTSVSAPSDAAANARQAAGLVLGPGRQRARQVGRGQPWPIAIERRRRRSGRRSAR